MNIQTDGPISTDLWQHRLFFRKLEGQWEDIFVSHTIPLTANEKEKRVDALGRTVSAPAIDPL